MQNLKSIKGYVNIDEHPYPFSFEVSDFILRLYPPTPEKWQDDMFSIFKNGFEPKEHKWIGAFEISGITSNNYEITFYVLDNPSNFNGFKEYKVQWVTYYYEGFDLNHIDGIRITGGDLNYFYSAERCLNQTIHLRENHTIEKMTVSSEAEEYLPCGCYSVKEDVDATLEVQAFAYMHQGNSKRPIDADTKLKSTFSSAVDIEVVNNTIFDIKKFLFYSLYRTNIIFSEIELCRRKDDGLFYYDGKLLFPENHIPESHKKVKQQLIGYDFWKEKAGDMLSIIHADKLGFNHICSNIEDRRHYPTSRFIMIFTEFEREFRNIYGTDYLRSDAYKETKSEVVDKLNELADASSGKKREYIRNISKGVYNTDNSYYDRVKASLIDCKKVMQPFVSKNYDGEYDEIIDGIADRAGQLRNGFAHSRLDLELEPVHLVDIKIIEELTYVMRLIRMKGNVSSVQKAINDLFGENISIKEDEVRREEEHDMYDYLIVGAGLYGAVCARELNDAGHTCLVIDKRNHIAGNVYTEKVEGINVHKYGAHIFHTNDSAVWSYVQRFATFNRFTNSPVANFKGELYSLPFNMYTFNKMWGVVTPEEAEAKIEEQRQAAGITEPKNLEEQAISLIGTDIYEKLVKGYTQKQWGRECKDLPAFIIKRLPVRLTFDNNYFNALYQGIPVGGYTKMVENMLEGIEVRTGEDYLVDKEKWDGLADKIIYTGPIDAYFNFSLGTLEYRSVRFENELLDIPNFQGNAAVNYTDAETPWTRIIEHKWFEFGKDNEGNDLPKTVISREYSSEWKPGDEPYYPVNDEKNSALYAQYKVLADKEDNVIFGGRLGEYKYYDMDQVIAAALAKASELK